MITPEIVAQFRGRMHLDEFEDNNIQSILEASYEDLRAICGDYDLTNNRFKELIFERSRYVYNDALEYFHKNFLTQINNLIIAKALEETSTGGEV
ncbi:hypothetical protein [Lysinibacillus fusiformis]|uniref:hypothetical protein n=1 Tax=Lysinibacillus fusiformis TaxID=28031 RepID=UPI0035BEC598|nr:hypothetical protein QYY55_15945 [Lysinibacillus fusiformis]